MMGERKPICQRWIGSTDAMWPWTHAAHQAFWSTDSKHSSLEPYSLCWCCTLHAHRAVPQLLSCVPHHMAAQMRAHWLDAVEVAVVVPASDGVIVGSRSEHNVLRACC